MAAKKILVVEDNEDNRRILIYRLRKIGDFEILEAVNGQQAVDVVREKQPDLIFMDLKMPVLDGWAATTEIRKLEGGDRVRIIALTAQAMSGDEEKALAAGCDDYLAKPVVDPNLVREKMERLLGPIGGEQDAAGA
jgi:two-component system cell cycle response regulator DivK